MKTRVLFTVALMAVLSVNLSAQEKPQRFGFELSGGASLVTNQILNTDLKPGFGFEGIFHYRILSNTGVYGGWGWNRFASDNSFAGNDVCFEETGYVFGLQYKQAIGTAPMSYYLRAGGLYNHIEIENAGGDIIHDTGHGFGWQLAAGLDLSLGSKWSITPGVKFNSLNRDLSGEGTPDELKMNYASVRIGILRLF